jgi:hypothetical protein
MLKSRRMAAHMRCASITKLLLRDVFSCDMPYVVPCDDIFIVKLLLVIWSRRPFDMRHVLYRAASWLLGMEYRSSPVRNSANSAAP